MVRTQHERELITYDIFADSLFTIKMSMNNLALCPHSWPASNNLNTSKHPCNQLETLIYCPLELKETLIHSKCIYKIYITLNITRTLG